MVRQAPIDLDSDSSESRHQAISTEVGSLKIGSPMQNQLNNERAIQNVMGKSSSRESDTTFTSIVTNVRRQGSQRKHSLISQDAPEPNLSKKTPETYYPYHTLVIQRKIQKKFNQSNLQRSSNTIKSVANPTA